MTDSTERRFLRFTATLWETGELEMGDGWETARISRRPLCAQGKSLRLLDEAGDVLVEVGVEVRKSICRNKGTRGVAGWRVVGYLPFVPSGRTVVFREGGIVRHRVELALNPPRIQMPSVATEKKGRLSVRWKAHHDRPLRFAVVFVDALRRAIPVARGLADAHVMLETAGLPGGRGCSVAVLATDGLRSASARSEPFDLPERPPLIMILSPADGEVVSADQPISLIGHARDLAGRTLPDDTLVWSVDGRVVVRGQRIAPAGPFEPGQHRIELACGSRGEIAARAHVSLHVPERSPAQRAWREVSASRAAADAYHRVAYRAVPDPNESCGSSA